MPKRNPYRCQIYGYRAELTCGEPAIIGLIWDQLLGYKSRPVLLCKECWLSINRGTGAYLPYDTQA